MSKNIFKFNQVIMQDDNTLMIDNNEKVAKKIEHVEELMLQAAKSQAAPEPLDGFASGLDAEQVEALVADEEEASVIKAENPGRTESFEVISAQSQEMLMAARREAEEIKSKALAEIQGELEDLKQQALAEGREQGFEKGYNEAAAQIETQRKNLEEDKKRLEKEYQELADSLEPKFVEALTDIYEKVFKIDLTKEHNIITHLLSSTMHKIEGSRNYLIHVSKEDYPYVCMKKEEMLAIAMSPNSVVEIVEDMTMGANDCIIETDGGVFDCGLGTQLEELAQKLRLLSYTKG